jgi:uncharacterized protein YodC (DUF2158 family)
MKNMMTIDRMRRLMLCLSVFLLAACIQNDLPYPTVKLYITGMSVEGQVGSAVISNDDRKVTLELEETVNPKKVKVQTLDITEGGTASVGPDSIVDLTKPLEITLSLYQDYVWTVEANQTIARIFTVAGQVGQAKFYPETREASVNIPKEQGLGIIELTGLKLGPEGSTHNGTTDLPLLYWTRKDNFATTKVQVKYSDFIDEEWTLYVNLSDITVGVNSVDAWTNVAWIHGFGHDGRDNGCEYKKEGDTDWIRVDASEVTHDGGNFTARIIHLQANTTYVCRAYSGEEYGEEMSFTTGEEATVPNMGFEDWHQDGKVICPWQEGDNRWWDTGNWGSTTLSEKDNITLSTEDIRTGSTGKFAAILKSQKIVVKFAAGNLFIGEYKKTVGTNGILGFGRSFTSCPTRLKGYFKYQTALITETIDKYASLKNQPDTCIVWVALGDWSLQENPDTGEKTAVEIQTDSKGNGKYFDKNDSHIIAYGEMTCGENVNEYTPFSVELKYRATDRKPTALLIVCSASKYGDYFTGAPGATMWVDDFSFEYDY